MDIQTSGKLLIKKNTGVFQSKAAKPIKIIFSRYIKKGSDRFTNKSKNF